MRYIGNKTRLLEFLGSVIARTPVSGNRAFDAFSGTASVGRYLKRRGFAVSSCDLMSYSLVFQKAYIELDRVPRFEKLIHNDQTFAKARGQRAFTTYVEGRFSGQVDLFSAGQLPHGPLQVVLAYLERFLPPEASFVAREYAPTDDADPDARRFFTKSNAQRIDAIRTHIHMWRSESLLDDDEYFLLLACLLESADAVANTTGVYAAYVKSWQSNALRPLQLNVPELVIDTNLDCRAMQGDVSELLKTTGPIDLLYLDPPYNTRQYSAYYHVPEVIARGWFEGEPELRGKTGLIPDKDRKSLWSTRGGCVRALYDLLKHADAGHVLMSYNSEGIIPESEIERIFCDLGRRSTYEVHELDYARYRADSDHEQRQYKSDRVTEKIYSVELRSLADRG